MQGNKQLCINSWETQSACEWIFTVHALLCWSTAVSALGHLHSPHVKTWCYPPVTPVDYNTHWQKTNDRRFTGSMILGFYTEHWYRPWQFEDVIFIVLSNYRYLNICCETLEHSLMIGVIRGAWICPAREPALYFWAKTESTSTRRRQWHGGVFRFDRFVIEIYRDLVRKAVLRDYWRAKSSVEKSGRCIRRKRRMSSANERQRTRLLDGHRERHAWRLWVSGPDNGRWRLR